MLQSMGSERVGQDLANEQQHIHYRQKNLKDRNTQFQSEIQRN